MIRLNIFKVKTPTITFGVHTEMLDNIGFSSNSLHLIELIFSFVQQQQMFYKRPLFNIDLLLNIKNCINTPLAMAYTLYDRENVENFRGPNKI